MLPFSGFTASNIFNAPGGKVETLVNENLSQGDHMLELSALNFANGVYFYCLHSGSFFHTKMLTFLQ